MRSNYRVTIINVSRSISEKGSPEKGLHTLNPIFRKGPLFYLEFNVRVFWILLLGGFDVISAVDLDSIPGCRMATWIRRRPLVFDAHEYFIKVPDLTHSRFKRMIWSWVERLFIRGLSGAYTVNETLAGIFSKRYNYSFDVVRNVPEMDVTQIFETDVPVKGEEWVLVYQGAINEGRGIELYIHAMDQLSSCRLWIIGKGDLDDHIQSLFEKSNSKSRIEIMGFVEPEKLASVTSKAHIGLNLLDPSSESYKYSLANRYYDFANAKIPAIHMNFPEYERANENCQISLLVDEYSVKALVTAIQKLISDPELYSRLQDNSKIAIQKNNWELEEIKLLNIYQKV